MIAWILVVALCLLGIVQRSLYKRACQDTLGITYLLEAVLIDEHLYRTQREDFLKRIHESDAGSSYLLSMKVGNALNSYAQDLQKQPRFALGVTEMLWAEKTGGGKPA